MFMIDVSITIWLMGLINQFISGGTNFVQSRWMARSIPGVDVTEKDGSVVNRLLRWMLETMVGISQPINQEWFQQFVQQHEHMKTNPSLVVQVV